MRWVGVDGDTLTIGPIAPGTTEMVPFVLTIPQDTGSAERLVGLEVASEHQQATLTELQLVTTSNAGVRIAAHPKTVRGRRGGRFELEITNRSERSERLEFGGGGDGVTVELPGVTVRPGQTTRVRGSVKARGHLGEERRRVVPLSATGDGPSNRTTLTLVQPSMLPLLARKATAIVAVLALWAGLLAGGITLTRKVTGSGKDSTEEAADLLARGEDGADGAGGADGDGAGGSQGAGGAKKGTAGAAGEESAPRGTEVSGLVDVGGADPADVVVTLRPVELGDTAPSAKPLAGNPPILAQQAPTPISIGGAAQPPGDPGKVWSEAQTGAGSDALSDVRTTTSNVDGEWGFAGIPFPGLYEIVFAKAGYDTTSYVVTVDSDKPVHFDVTLKPGRGTLGGTVRSDAGPLADVDVTITDGTVTYRTSTTELSGGGAWAMDGLGTPARYTITFSRRGYGTETLAADLSTGQSLTGLTATMALGVGSISGTVFHGGTPLGGASVVVSDGQSERSTTTLTAGAVGSYLVPQLIVGTTYTVTFARPGFISQTLTVNLADNASGINADLRASTASVYGTVTDSVTGDGVSGVGISLTNGTEIFKSTTTVSPPGSFELNGLPPGSYVVEFGRFEYEKASALLSVVGGDRIGKDVALVPRPAIELPANASVAGTILDSRTGDGLPGARVKVVGHPLLAGAKPAETTTAADGRYSLAGLSLGTWTVEISGPETPKFQPITRTVRLGSSTSATVDATLLPLGSITGTITSATGTPLRGARIKIDGLAGVLTAGDGGVYKSGADLSDGTYRVTYSMDGFQSQVKDVTVRVGETSTIDVVLYQFPTVSGRVLRPLGAPVSFTGLEGMEVRAHSLDGTSVPDAVVSTDRSGQFVIPFENLPPGQWQITASQPATSTLAPGFLPTTVQRSLQLGQSLTLDLVLSPRIGVKGTVIWKDVNDRDHRIGDAEILASDVLTAYAPSLTSSSQLPVQTTQLTGVSAADGTWRVEGQIGGRSAYRARGAGLVDSAATEVTVVPGDPEPSLDIVLQPVPQSLSGQLQPRPGGTPDGFTVTVVATGVAPSTTTTAGDGRFTVPALRPGSYRVTFTKTGFADLVTEGIVPLGAPGDMGMVFADQLATLKVTALSRVGSAPLVGARVQLFAPGSSTVLASGTTAADGTITFPNLQPRPTELYDLKAGADLHVDGIGTAAVTTFGQNATADIVLDRLGAVTGVVQTDTLGTRAAVADLEVTLRPVGGGNAVTKRTDAGGRYRFDGVVTGRYTVSATRAGFTQDPTAASVELTVTLNNDTAADIVLARKAAIWGVLSTDVVGTVTPLPATEVTLTPKAGGTPTKIDTDSDGKFRFTDLAPGDYTLAATRTGFTQNPPTADVTVTASLNQDTRADIVLARKAAIWGVLSTDVVGTVTPLPATEVTLTPKAGGTPTKIDTDSDGKFRFTDLAPGDYTLAATRTGFTQNPPTADVTVTASLNQDTRADIVLARKAAIWGVLSTDVVGTVTPLPATEVTLTPKTGGTPTKIDTDSDGKFRFTDLAPGVYVLAVTRTGFAQEPAVQEATATLNTDTQANITLLRNGALKGTVYGQLPDGTVGTNPIKLGQAKVTAIRAGTSRHVDTDANGAYLIEDLAPGAYTLTVTKAGFTQPATPAITATVVVNQDVTQDITLLRNGALKGTIHGQLPDSTVGTNPIKLGQAKVTARQGSISRQVDTDANGAYLIEDLAPGAYTLTVTKAGFTQPATPATTATVVVNQDVTQDITLLRNAAIVGTLSTDTLGVKAALATTDVSLTPAAGGAATTVRTDADGKFRFDDLAPGQYTLGATRAGFTQTAPSAAVTAVVNTDLTADIVLGRNAAIVGTLFTDTLGVKAALASTDVSLTPVAGGTATKIGTDTNGRFSFVNLAPGQYTVSATRNGFTQTAPAAAVTAVLNTDVTADIVLERNAAIVGTLYTDTTGTRSPLANTDVSLTPGTATTRTDANGRFSFVNLAPGQYTVSATRNGFTQTAPAAAVIAVLNTDVTADIVLERNGAVTGLVLTGLTNGPLADATVTVTPDGGGTAVTAKTDGDGRYRVGGLTPGRYGVSVAATNHVTSAAVTVTVSRNADAPADVTLTRRGQIAGVVGTNTVGTVAAVPAARVTLTPTSPAGTARSVDADANGRYSFDDLGEGTYALSATVAGYVQSGGAVTVAYNQTTDGNLTFLRLGALVGTVTAVRAGAETPLAGVEVVATLGGTTTKTNTDGNGAYRIANLAAGSYTVSVSYAGYTQTSPSASVAVALNENRTTDVTLTAASARLIGKVITDTNGSALNGVTVRATYTVGGTTSSASCVTPCNTLAGATGAAGTFAFADLPPTAVTLSFVVPDHHNLTRTATTLSPATTTDVGTVILLGNNGAVTGTVKWSPVGFTTASYPQGGATLTLTRQQTDGSFAEARTTTSGSDGAYTFPGLDKGTYKLETTHADFQIATSTSFTVDGATASTKDVTLTPVKRSLVVNVESSRGGPVVGASVQLSGGAATSQSLTTSSSGAVTFANVNPGPTDLTNASQYKLRITANNFDTLANFAVVVGTSGDTTADIELTARATVSVPVAFDPAPGTATVTLTPIAPTTGSVATQACTSTCTFARVSPGTYRVGYGNLTNYAPPAPVDITVTQTEDLTLATGTYRRYARVTLKISDPNNTGVTSATVSPRPANATSDTIARNTVMNLVPGQTYTFSIAAVTNVNQALSTTASFTTNQVADQSLSIAGEGRLEVEVQDSAANPGHRRQRHGQRCRHGWYIGAAGVGLDLQQVRCGRVARRRVPRVDQRGRRPRRRHGHRHDYDGHDVDDQAADGIHIHGVGHRHVGGRAHRQRVGKPRLGQRLHNPLRWLQLHRCRGRVADPRHGGQGLVPGDQYDFGGGRCDHRRHRTGHHAGGAGSRQQRRRHRCDAQLHRWEDRHLRNVGEPDRNGHLRRDRNRRCHRTYRHRHVSRPVRHLADAIDHRLPDAVGADHHAACTRRLRHLTRRSESARRSHGTSMPRQ